MILSQTLQAMHEPKTVLSEMLRIGKRAIVSFPNFGYWQLRLKFCVTGRMPSSEALPYKWYDTPNVHLCTIHDFVALCPEKLQSGSKPSKALPIVRYFDAHEAATGKRPPLRER